MTTFQSASRITIAPDDRVEQLRQKLGYPVQQRDPQGSDFFYLRPGNDVEEAEETCPIAVGFYPELNDATDERSLQQLLTSSEWQQRIYGHYLNRTAEQQPVMYILMPTEEGAGQVPLILPTEGGLRQRNIQTFAWGSAELETRLNRLRQEELPVAARALTTVPLVERVFYKPIQTAKELAQLLATAARRIEQILPEVYQDEKRRYPASKGEEGYLHKLLKSFQQELLPSLQLVSENEKDYSFSDIYAQTIAYSLFTARVFGYVRDRESGRKESLFDRQSAWQQLPETNPFLRKLFQDVSERSPEELGDELIGAIADVFAILRAAKMDVILQDFRQKQNREDIVIRFYEDFLAAYKPQMRERRGVYYTPEPVVSYMVRSVDVLLKEKFDKPLGLADPEVMILDPACGTGTFLLWICQLIHDRFHTERAAMIARVGDISWSEYVSEHLLPRIFGFELLMAPYAIAHLKIGLFLQETGYLFERSKRLEIYLTNTLESAARRTEILFDTFISEEADQASAIKRDKPIMLMIGNPPYSISSSNKSEFIEDLMDSYKQSVRSEKNIQPLSDDYIKFIRFAQHQIEKTGYGIIGYITNNSYLEGLIHRGMREELLKTLDEIHLLNLRGNSLLNQTPPQGITDDQNVFDIKQGVAVTIGLKNSSQDGRSSHLAKVSHHELWGNRQFKYSFLCNSTILSENASLQPSQPYFFFVPKNLELESEYLSFTSVLDIFSLYKNGIQSGHDEFATDHQKQALEQRLSLFYSSCEDDLIQQQFRLTDKSGWNFQAERRTAIAEGYQSELLQPYFYRPFEQRWIYFSKRILKRPVVEVMQHMLQDNLALVLCRQQVEVGFQHTFITNLLGDCNAISIKSREFNYYFPLYQYPDICNNQTNLLNQRTVNFTDGILTHISSCIGYTPAPEAVLYYIYAILHSPAYRARYAEFLKIDFPRIPLTCDNNLFRQLATYGEQLVDLHLMKSSKLDQPITQFSEQGGNGIVDAGHPKYSNGKVTINKKGDGFVGVPEAVWNFYVGGYQVCVKWLKDRKGRTLTSEDITHYQRIVVALQETMCLMQLIDEAIPQFPIV